MGDHRASIQIAFEMHGHRAETDLWINWSPDSDGVDRRVTEWVAAQADIAMSNWFEAEEKATLRSQAEVENLERATLAALQEKYAER